MKVEESKTSYVVQTMQFPAVQMPSASTQMIRMQGSPRHADKPARRSFTGQEIHSETLAKDNGQNYGRDFKSPQSPTNLPNSHSGITSNRYSMQREGVSAPRDSQSSSEHYNFSSHADHPKGIKVAPPSSIIRDPTCDTTRYFGKEESLDSLLSRVSNLESNISASLDAFHASLNEYRAASNGVHPLVSAQPPLRPSYTSSFTTTSASPQQFRALEVLRQLGDIKKSKTMEKNIVASLVNSRQNYMLHLRQKGDVVCVEDPPALFDVHTMPGSSDNAEDSLSSSTLHLLPDLPMALQPLELPKPISHFTNQSDFTTGPLRPPKSPHSIRAEEDRRNVYSRPYSDNRNVHSSTGSVPASISNHPSINNPSVPTKVRTLVLQEDPAPITASSPLGSNIPSFSGPSLSENGQNASRALKDRETINPKSSNEAALLNETAHQDEAESTLSETGLYNMLVKQTNISELPKELLSMKIPLQVMLDVQERIRKERLLASKEASEQESPANNETITRGVSPIAVSTEGKHATFLPTQPVPKSAKRVLEMESENNEQSSTTKDNDDATGSSTAQTEGSPIRATKYYSPLSPEVYIIAQLEEQKKLMALNTTTNSLPYPGSPVMHPAYVGNVTPSYYPNSPPFARPLVPGTVPGVVPGVIPGVVPRPGVPMSPVVLSPSYPGSPIIPGANLPLRPVAPTSPWMLSPPKQYITSPQPMVGVPGAASVVVGVAPAAVHSPSRAQSPAVPIAMPAPMPMRVPQSPMSSPLNPKGLRAISPFPNRALSPPVFRRSASTALVSGADGMQSPISSVLRERGIPPPPPLRRGNSTSMMMPLSKLPGSSQQNASSAKGSTSGSSSRSGSLPSALSSRLQRGSIPPLGIASNRSSVNSSLANEKASTLSILSNVSKDRERGDEQLIAKLETLLDGDNPLLHDDEEGL